MSKASEFSKLAMANNDERVELDKVRPRFGSRPESIGNRPIAEVTDSGELTVDWHHMKPEKAIEMAEWIKSVFA